MLGQALAVLGVLDGCRADILLAVAEARNNAVDHARTVQEYEVVVTVDREWCVAEVIDRGTGAAGVPHAAASVMLSPQPSASDALLTSHAR